MSAAAIILFVAGGYLAVGVVVALWFVTVGVGRVDPVAKGGTWGFRVLILPGSAALWPWVVVRARRGGKGGHG